MSSHFEELTEQEINWLKTIEECLEEEERIGSIWSVIRSQKSATCRFLINIYQNCMWRGTKYILVSAIAATQDQRGVEFLIQLVHSQSDDLPLLANILLALGLNQSNTAAEFLLSIVNEKNHPLQKSAIIALKSVKNRLYEEKLLTLLDDQDHHESLNQTIILALGYRGGERARVAVEALLQPLVKEGDVQQYCVLLSLGRLGTNDTLLKLRSTVVDKMSLADELASLATSQIKYRKSMKIEDAILSLTNRNNKEEFEESLRYLQSFSAAEVWEHVEVFRSEMDVDTLCRIKACHFDVEHFEQDKTFIAENYQEISHESLGLLLVSYPPKLRNQLLDYIFTFMGIEDFSDLCHYVTYQNIIEKFDGFLLDDKIQEQIKIQLINVIALHGLSLPLKAPWRIAIGEFLFDIFKKINSQTVGDRLLRSLGQLQFCNKKVMKEFLSMLAKNSDVSNSLYQCLMNVRHRQLENSLLLRLKKIVSEGILQKEVKPILKVLAAYGKLSDCEQFPQLLREDIENNEISILRILAFNKISVWSDLILKSLESDIYQIKILAIVAAKLNGDKDIWEKLFPLAKDSNHSISIRAIDSLCVGGDLSVQFKLVQEATQEQMDKEVLLKIFRSLIPKPRQNYVSVVKYLDSLTAENHPSVQDHEVLTAALNLRDSLEISFAHDLEATKNEDSISDDSHNIDDYLSSRLNSFDDFSRTIKSVLRNAEITFRNRKLFDYRVDKSTIVIELTKSIDLLLNEKLGNEIFFNDDLNLIEKMQSVLMMLDLQTNNRKALVKTLQLEPQFDPDTFPALKLESMIQIIASGKLKVNKNRCFDGLRSWSLLLLLFGRDYHVRSRKIDPIFPVKKSSNQFIKNIAYKLDKIQELRNRAAHRGTFFKMKTLESIKEDSFHLLNELTDLV